MLRKLALCPTKVQMAWDVRLCKGADSVWLEAGADRCARLGCYEALALTPPSSKALLGREGVWCVPGDSSGSDTGADRGHGGHHLAVPIIQFRDLQSPGRNVPYLTGT